MNGHYLPHYFFRSKLFVQRSLNIIFSHMESILIKYWSIRTTYDLLYKAEVSSANRRPSCNSVDAMHNFLSRPTGCCLMLNKKWFQIYPREGPESGLSTLSMKIMLCSLVTVAWRFRLQRCYFKAHFCQSEEFLFHSTRRHQEPEWYNGRVRFIIPLSSSRCTHRFRKASLWLPSRSWIVITLDVEIMLFPNSKILIHGDITTNLMIGSATT
jgi:hypothetical protein